MPCPRRSTLTPSSQQIYILMSEKPGCQISGVHVTGLHVSAPLPLLFGKLLFLQDTKRKKGLPDLLISKCGLITLSSSKESSVSRELAYTNGCPDDISHPFGHVLLLQRRLNCSMSYLSKVPDAHTAWNFAYPTARNMACKTLSCTGGQPNTSGFGNCWCLLLQGTVFCRVTDIMWYLGNIEQLKHYQLRKAIVSATKPYCMPDKPTINSLLNCLDAAFWTENTNC